MWNGTPTDATTLAAEHIAQLRKTDRNIDADALEYLLFHGAERNDNAAHFPVVGAGEVELGTTLKASCGTAHGIHVGVSWGQHGYAGGVMDRADVRRMADHLTNLLNPPAHEDAKAVPHG